MTKLLAGGTSGELLAGLDLVYLTALFVALFWAFGWLVAVGAALCEGFALGLGQIFICLLAQLTWYSLICASSPGVRSRASSGRDRATQLR